MRTLEQTKRTETEIVKMIEDARSSLELMKLPVGRIGKKIIASNLKEKQHAVAHEVAEYIKSLPRNQRVSVIMALNKVAISGYAMPGKQKVAKRDLNPKEQLTEMVKGYSNICDLLDLSIQSKEDEVGSPLTYFNMIKAEETSIINLVTENPSLKEYAIGICPEELIEKLRNIPVKPSRVKDFVTDATNTLRNIKLPQVFVPNQPQLEFQTNESLALN